MAVPLTEPDAEPRRLGMARSGRFVALRRGDGLELVDALGTAPRRTLPAPVLDFGFVANELWLLGPGGLQRYSVETLTPIGPVIEIAADATRVLPSRGDASTTALVGHQLVEAIGDCATVTNLAGSVLFPLGGRHVLSVGDSLGILDGGRGERRLIAWPAREPVHGATYLFGGRAIAVLVGGQRPRIIVLAASGGLIHDVALPSATDRAVFADRRGLALLAHGERELIAVDLRYGRIQLHGQTPFEVEDLAIDADARFLAYAGGTQVLHGPFNDLIQAPRTAPQPVTESIHADATEHAPPAVESVAAPVIPSLAIPELLPRALGEVFSATTVAAQATGAEPYAGAREHVDDLLDVAAARTARGIAEAWNTGRLSLPAEDARPFEREVLAIVGRAGSFADDLVGEFEQKLSDLELRVAARTQATLAAGGSLPFVDLVHELGLSAMAAKVLAVVLAPQMRGEIARLYGVLANDVYRPLVDRALVETVIAGSDSRMRAAVADELVPEATLIRLGVIRRTGDSTVFAGLSVDQVILDRIHGRDLVELGGATVIRTATRTLAELTMPAAIKRDLVLAMSKARSPEEPIRIALRGRRGSGRHSLIATLAAKVGRRVAAIDATRLSRQPEPFAYELALELSRAQLRRAVPVVSGLELIAADDTELRDRIEQVLRRHPGPVVLRVAPETTTLPLAPGYVSFTIPAMSEAERIDAWRASLTRAGVGCEDVETLAQKFRIGPGTIEQIVQESAQGHGDLETLARQHLAARLSHVATHITRLAKWEQVALPDDLRDSLKELVGRVRHRRTVYDTWGFDAKMTTSRGLSALFYGPPGTGKSMIAGLVARELGLDLYRVDLARITSKWIGETEKNLAEVFDAAEAGQAVILFDEADSLFAKRTEVRSSTDRYANLEVNYLLQRLDTFEGICILTTNLDGAIDPAFKRRMSLRLQFPFPDEETRVQLWAAHVPSEAPVAGDLDFADLARRFPLSGGYIRNSALRAAFLAAQEARPLSQEHLVRAVQLEYREIGKLAPSGRLE